MGAKTVLLRGECLLNYTLENLRLPRGWIRSGFRGERIDYALGLSLGDCRAEPMENYRPFSRLADAHDFNVRFKNQAKDFFAEKNVRLILMDTAAEVILASFANRETGARFCALYGAVDRSDAFRRRYEIGARLTAEELERHCRGFFTRIRETYGPVPVVCLCLSAACDPRPEWRVRCEAVNAVFEKMSREFSNVRVYRMDYVEKRRDGDDHPYHYTAETYRRLAERVAADRVGGVRLAWRCPEWLRTIGHFFYEKKKGDHGVRTVRILALTFSYVSRRKRGKTAE